MNRIFILFFLCFLFFFTAGYTQHNNPNTAFSVSEPVKDTRGNPVNAHGAGILKYKGVYYLFGEIKKGKTWLVPGQNWEDYRVPAGGVSCYSSQDLIHWKNEGIALSPTTGNASGELDTSKVIERPKVIYNKQTKKFVMWMHIDANDYGFSQAGVAISNNPEGPYKYLGSVKPNGQMARDMTLFQDDDQKAYLVYASENNNTMHICLLNKDYLSPSEKYTRILVNEHREAPAMFKHLGKYYLVSSLCSGWDPNAVQYSVADSIMGTWKQQGNPCVGVGAETTFNSQSTFVLPINEKTGDYIFMADKWNKTDLESSKYLWLRLQVRNGKVVIGNSKTSIIR
jgi:beta-xylosidase